MFLIVLKEKCGDIIYNAIYLFLLIINTTSLIILFSTKSLLKAVNESSFMKETEASWLMQNPSLIENFKMIYSTGTVFIVIAGIALSIILICIIAGHINKWKTDISLQHTLGFKAKNVISYIFIRNAADTIIAAIISFVVSHIIWIKLTGSKFLAQYIKESNVKSTLNYPVVAVICIAVLLVQMCIGIALYRKIKNKNIRYIDE